MTGRIGGWSVELESTIYIAPMSQFNYEHNQFVVSYLVHDSVLALSNAISVAATRQLLAAGGPGLCPKQLNPTNQSLAFLLCGNGQELLSGRGLDQNPISSHYASIP